MFEKALRKSTAEENFVLEEAEALRRKGYSVREIYDVLAKLKQELVMDRDVEVVGEALEEFGRYLAE